MTRLATDPPSRQIGGRHVVDAPRIELGTNVWAGDGLLVGRVGRLWHPGGSITPPLPGMPGQPDIVAGAWGTNENPGVLQVNRFQAPDWFIPFTDIASVTDRDVHLAFTEKQGRQRGWQHRMDLFQPGLHRRRSHSVTS